MRSSVIWFCVAILCHALTHCGAVFSRFVAGCVRSAVRFCMQIWCYLSWVRSIHGIPVFCNSFVRVCPCHESVLLQQCWILTHLSQDQPDIATAHIHDTDTCTLYISGHLVDFFVEGPGPPTFEFPRAPSKIWRVSPLKYITNSPSLGGQLGPQAKFHKGPIGFSGARGPYLRAPECPVYRALS